MRRRKRRYKAKEINYRLLRTGDVVNCGGFGPFAYIIRLATKGFKRRHDYKNVSTHTGIIVDFGGQKFMAEMRPGGLELNSLEDYRKNKRRFIVDIVRSTDLTDNKRIALLQSISKDLRKGIEYDWKGDVKFVLKKVRNSRSKYFCSEYVAWKLRVICSVTVKDSDCNIAPEDLQFPSKAVPSLMPIKWTL